MNHILKRFSGMKSLISYLLVLEISLTGCFRLVPREDSIKINQQLIDLKAANNYIELCKLSLNPIDKEKKGENRVNSSMIFKYAGDCLKNGLGNTDIDLVKAISNYKNAIVCGDREPEKILSELNQEIPNIRYEKGVTVNYNIAPDKCGFHQELTTIGWIVAFPPMAVLALPAGLLLVVAGSVLMIVAVPFS